MNQKSYVIIKIVNVFFRLIKSQLSKTYFAEMIFFEIFEHKFFKGAGQNGTATK